MPTKQLEDLKLFVVNNEKVFNVAHSRLTELYYNYKMSHANSGMGIFILEHALMLPVEPHLF